ncbi:hypothetical protein P154DRAFT_444089 [Amniculicola lignicola CBS 123094]|uniref:F-box domain-containing protein n=1 Tax=Amniculicola lignicola CBS 123094 TaxID=1392246 RepID=A0A6A5W494_9PLEO|nr:hypothetical protein P154DRAFT_444089 [Amniculicola lignicola CBS 123094]
MALRSVPALENNGQDLLRLFPTEIRLMIFEELLVLQPETIFRGAYEFNQLSENEFEDEIPVPWEILQTCRQYHDEAAPILYGKNKFVFCTGAGGDPGMFWRYPISRRYMRYVTDLGIYLQSDEPQKQAAQRISHFVRALARHTTRLKHLVVLISSDRFYDSTCPWDILFCCNPVAKALDFLVGSEKVQYLKVRVHDGAMLFPNYAMALNQKFEQGSTADRSITFSQSCSCPPKTRCHHDPIEHCCLCGWSIENIGQKPIETIVPPEYIESCEQRMMDLQHDLFHKGLLPPRDDDDSEDEEDDENGGIYRTGHAATDDYEEKLPAFHSVILLPGQERKYRSPVKAPKVWFFRQTLLTEFFKVIADEEYLATTN